MVHTNVTKDGEGVSLQRPLPVRSSLAMSPAGLVCVDGSIRSLSERRHLYSPASLGLRVSTVRDGRTVLICSLASPCETHGRVAAYTDVPAAPIDSNAMDPRLRSRLPDEKMQTLPIGVPTRLFECLNLRGGEQCHVYPPILAVPLKYHTVSGMLQHSAGTRKTRNRLS